MRAAFSFLSEPIYFGENPIQLLVLENKKLFRQVCDAFQHELEENYFIFSKDYKPFSFAKKGMFLSDPLRLPLRDKKLLTKTNAELENIANEKMYLELLELQEHLMAFAERLSAETEFAFSFTDEISASSWLKLLDFTPRYEERESDLENMLLFLQLCQKYLGIQCFVLTNLYVYFTPEELEPFLKSAALHQISLLLLESSIPAAISVEQISIVDKDLCEIVDK
jgi:CRISPR type II-A-associated protein Csn2